MSGTTLKRIFKFTFQNPEVNAPLQSYKLAWYSGTSIQQIEAEIKKMCGMPHEQRYNLLLLDEDECGVILSDDMDFNATYMVKLIPITQA
jgi:hypothetical protein